ncbi:MAG: protein-L-isoaspartate(D-aspartate) O-methyltransferase [Gammaproteobacteria bacterium]|nr:protein-L-isoaspartate(D-aspartate) O-methyltransferase [Gammaproteobacteria bacterium]
MRATPWFVDVARGNPGLGRDIAADGYRSAGGVVCRLAALLVLGLGAVIVLPAAGAQPAPEVLLESPAPESGVERPRFDNAPQAADREAMVTDQIEARGVTDERTLAALRRVPRHEFVPEAARGRAYDDTPLPIGHGQTISQPYIVGFMTELLELDPGDRVLEVGTGSAYQAAILAEIVRDVVTIEIVEPLARSAANRLERLGYGNLTVLHGDGYYGYDPAGPYDAIIVTAAASHVPPPLIRQLKPGGRIAIPVGRGWTQNLLLVEKDEQGETSTRNLMAVRFVPLTGER